MTEAAKILIVDDEFITAWAFADLLADQGYSIVGPFANQEDALASLTTTALDAAFIDINLGRGETSERLARQLKEQATPFAFITGYSECPPVMADFDDATYLAKPISKDKALAELRRMIPAS